MRHKRNGRFKAVSVLLSALLLFILAVSSLACAKKPESGGEPEPEPLWKSTYTLPDADIAYEELKDVYGGEDKIFLLQSGRIARMPCPKDGAAMVLNFTYEVAPYTRIVLEDCVNEFNEVFKVINPNYRFEINYSPKEEDFESEYSIRMTSKEQLSITETSMALGMAHISYYSDFTLLGDFGIILKNEVLGNGSYFMTTFKHELMHLLGAGDAYKNSAATKDTIMQSYTVGGYHHLSESDVRFLDTLYRNPENPNTDKFIEDYIADYETVTAHTRANNTAAVYRALVESTDTKALKTQIDAKGYKDVTALKAAVGDALEIDTDFGKESVSFAEPEYVERPERTYFDSFDPENHTWSHGYDKGTLSSTETLKYTDYGNGILYAEPNGNLYTLFVKTGDYVLALELTGSFTALDDLELALRYACEIK